MAQLLGTTHPSRRLTSLGRAAWHQMRVYYEGHNIYPGDITAAQAWEDMGEMLHGTAARNLHGNGSPSAQATFKAAWRRIGETYTSRDRDELRRMGAA